MKTLARWSTAAGIVALLLGLFAPAQATAAEITGEIEGFERAPQCGSHGALFVFAFDGEVNGRSGSGWGWIEVLHEPLPEDGGPTPIFGGRGALWIGWRRFRIDVGNGLLVSRPSQSGVFDVAAPLDVRERRGRPVPHDFFDGTLSHLTFPPTIQGTVQPSGLGE